MIKRKKKKVPVRFDGTTHHQKLYDHTRNEKKQEKIKVDLSQQPTATLARPVHDRVKYVGKLRKLRELVKDVCNVPCVSKKNTIALLSSQELEQLTTKYWWFKVFNPKTGKFRKYAYFWHLADIVGNATTVSTIEGLKKPESLMPSKALLRQAQPLDVVGKLGDGEKVPHKARVKLRRRKEKPARGIFD